MMQFVTKSKNGMAVYVDPAGSHAATHLRDTPNLLELTREIIGQTVLEADSMMFETDMGRIAGNSDLVDVERGDDVVYAKRSNRDNYTKFVRGKVPVPTRYVTLILKRLDGEKYELWSAWIGGLAPPFPGEEGETPESRPFWATHALAWGNQAIQPGTETTTQPW